MTWVEGVHLTTSTGQSGDCVRVVMSEAEPGSQVRNSIPHSTYPMSHSMERRNGISWEWRNGNMKMLVYENRIGNHRLYT